MKTEILIAKKLLQIKAIKLNPQNPFTWASGIKSPIYCDNRLTLSYPEVRKLIKNKFCDLINNLEKPDMIAGVATAGIPHGALIADALELPFSYVRAAAKTHGRQNHIEGEILPNSKIIVVEDLISTGGSSLEAVEILRTEGHQVICVVAIFDYEFEKAKENFRNSDCNYFTLSSYSYLINEALDADYITKEDADILSTWNHDPQNWYENNFA
jgi:orotate phosphoribosyltransferase